jgi:hypothetical protein
MAVDGFASILIQKPVNGLAVVTLRPHARNPPRLFAKVGASLSFCRDNKHNQTLARPVLSLTDLSSIKIYRRAKEYNR